MSEAELLRRPSPERIAAASLTRLDFAENLRRYRDAQEALVCRNLPELAE